MTSTEDRLRSLLQSAAPHLDGVAPEIVADEGRSRRPFAVTGGVVLVVGLAIILTVLFGAPGKPGTPRNSETPPPAHSQSAPSSSTGHIAGRLLISPPFSKRFPTAGTIVIDGPLHAVLAVSPSGRFEVTVPIGRYTILGHSPRYEGNNGDCITQGGPAIVRADQTIRVSVACLEK